MNKTYGGVCPKCGETIDGGPCKCYRKLELKSCPTLTAIIEKQYMPDGLHYLVSQQELYAILTDITELEDRCEKAENKGECVWTNYDDDDNIWETKCGETFQISNGTPAENGMKYCHGCARKIKEVYPESEAPHGK